MTGRRARLAGGVLGPGAFLAAWAWGSATTDGYSAVADPISRLAAVGAASRPVTTLGLLAFAAGVGAYAAELRTEVPGRTWVPAAVTAASSIAIALTPLEGPWGGAPHAVAAGAAYASLVTFVVAGAGPLAPAGVSKAVAAASAACLLASVAGPEATTGLFQRAGLTVGHAWIAATAASRLRRRR